MLRFLPILLVLAYGLIAYRFSVWRTQRDLDARATILHDTSLAPQMEAMARALDIPRLRVHIYEIPTVNGLAAPDGRIFITRGLYQLYRDGQISGAELCSVIAHELGHVALGHTRRRMIDFSGQNALRMALAAVLSRFIPGFGAMIASGLTSLLAARMSRDDEFAADSYATALMLKSGLGAAPQLSLFDKLASANGRQIATTAWLATHPATPERLAAIRHNAARWQA